MFLFFSFFKEECWLIKRNFTVDDWHTKAAKFTRLLGYYFLYIWISWSELSGCQEKRGKLSDRFISFLFPSRYSYSPPPPSLSFPLFLLIPSPYVRRSLSLYPSPSLSFYIFIPLFPSPFLPLLLCPFHSIKKYFIYLYSHVTDSYNPIHIFIHTIHL